MKHSLPKLILILCLLFLSSTFIFAQEAEEEMPAEEVPAEKGPFNLGLGMVLGYTAFAEDENGEPQTYQKLALTPDLAIGEFGIGLELAFHYRFVDGECDFRQEDWIVNDEHPFLDQYLPIFRYIRWAQKGAPLFIKFGSIDDATLGNGFIMGNYSNTLFMPETRIFGLNFDMDGSLFTFPLFGIETVVGNLAVDSFDIAGGRFYLRPLCFTTIPVLMDLELGATLAADIKPFQYAGQEYIDAVESQGVNTDNASMLAFGFDITQPILKEFPFTLSLFTDLAYLDTGKYWGYMFGTGGRLIDFITYGGQIRILGDNFIPVFFDSTYDISRAIKYNIIKSGGIDPYVGGLVSLGLDFVDIFLFTVIVEGPFAPINDDPNNYLNYPHLRAILGIGQGLIPGVNLNSSWDKIMIEAPEDIIDPAGAVLNLRFNYTLGMAQISLFYQIRYVPDPEIGTNPWEQTEVSSGLESSLNFSF